MKRSTLMSIALLALACGVFYFAEAEISFRNQNGQVTEVNLLNYDQEVLQVKDNKAVVLVFFKDVTGIDAAQLKVLRSFAWHNAHAAKVVFVNVAHIENLPLAIAYGALRQPTVVMVAGDRQVVGASGAAADYDELNRLLALLTTRR